MSDTLILKNDHDADAFLGVRTSVSGRKWLERDADEDAIAQIARQQQIPDVLARVISGRGISADNAASFLSPRLRDEFPDPSSFADMDKAAGLIWDVLDGGKKLAVFADYDVDGASSAAQLIIWARALGTEMDLYVPDRVGEGYGPTVQAFQILKDRGADLVITVDCGATSHEALKGASDMALDVIVVDHHLMDGEMPPCAALVNPNRSDDHSGCGHMAAAGVTFVLLAALNREGRRRGRFEGDLDEPNLLHLIDLAALGTICDVVALTGVNRCLTAQGLKAMSDWRHLGLRKLAEVSGVSGAANTYHAGFLLGPRINAGGRVGQANLGARLLSTTDEDEATRIAIELDRLNKERRGIESAVMDEALAQIEGQGASRSILVATGEGWHPGVIGVVAGRLKEKYAKPCLIIALNRDGETPIGKGSGRSVAGVNLGGAISAARDAGLLISGGGHAMAGGLSVDPDRITELIAFLDERLTPELAKSGDAMALKLDGLISAAGIDVDLIDVLDQAAPYGQGHSEPRFAIANIKVNYAQLVGADHVRFTLEDRDLQRISGIAFRCADSAMGQALLAADGREWHAAGRLKINEWKGRKSVQFQLEDLAAVK